MDDRRLLELAAKAAGHNDVELLKVCGEWMARTRDGALLNYLHNDGDAFRLAVAIGFHRNMIIEIGVGGVCVDVGHPHIEADEFQDPHAASFDPYAATRRAIVRAAAAIGEKMGEKG
jgi:hypothetical protein